MEELYREIEEKIALSREEYEEYKSDVQRSVTVAKSWRPLSISFPF